MDIRTLAAILGITHAIQILVFSLQASINRAQRGIGWWLLWSASAAMGFGCLLLRAIPAIERIAIVAQSALIVLATLFLYLGIVRFLGKAEARLPIAFTYAAFVIALAYFTYGDNDVAVRTVIICLALAASSFLSAQALLTHKTRAVRATAYFCAAVFLVHGGVFLHRAGMVLVGTQVGDMFRPTLFNAIPFLDGILASVLWTCGLIIMVNQGLNADTKEAKERLELLIRRLSSVVEEQKRADVALRESEGRLAEAQAMAQLGSWTWDVKTGCVEWTEEVFRIFERDPREFVPQIDSILALSPWPEDHERDKELIRRAMETREKGSYEQRFLRPDGSVGCYHSTFQGKYDDGGDLIGIVGTLQDITERKRAEAEARRLFDEAEASRLVLLSVVEDQKRAEEEVRRVNAELERRVGDRTAQLAAANRELEAFSYSVSHDLRAPLRAINGYAQILSEDYGAKLDAEGLRVLRVVRSEALRMGQLIDDLLRFSRLGRQPLCKTPTDMTALVHEVQADLLRHAPGRAVDWRVGSLPVVSADRALLRQVWFNLLDNALKYTRHREHAEIVVAGSSQGGEALFSVKDNGAGFDMRYAGKLFGVFQRLHGADEFEGTGVGLALVQRLVQRHGGRVWAEAELDRGATFHFGLPLEAGSVAAGDSPGASETGLPQGEASEGA